jgi:N-acetyl-alpha-D-muramate 1-phosphate uridylyltransferase
LTKQTKEIGIKAMILAAGLGRRMRPLTDRIPKPLVRLGGKALIDYSLDMVQGAGISDIVVNHHHLGSMVKDHVSALTGFNIFLSDESDQLLETGGGVAKVLDQFEGQPFFVLNSDVIVQDALENSLLELRRRWDSDKMDALLLLHPVATAVGYTGKGDFIMAANGRLERRPELEMAPFMFTGIQLLSPELFNDCPQGPFSLNLIYDKAAESDRLYGLRHQGKWLHVGTEAALAEAEGILMAS